MICDSCKIDKLDNDFINNKNICFRCVYREKTEKIRERRTRKQCFCRVCGTKVHHQENLKKRQRTVFCSSECAKQGHKEVTKNYWTRTIGNKGSNGK